VRWASDQIRLRVLSRIANAKLESFLAEALRNPPLYATQPTKEYERWTTLMISGRMTLNVFYIDPVNIETRKRKGTVYLEDCSKPKTIMGIRETSCPIALPPREIVRVSALNIATVRAGDHLYVSSNPNEPLCDAITLTCDGILILFQMTLGKEHGVVANTFNKYIADIQELRKQGDTFIQRVVLVFVVPWKANFLLEVSEWMKVPKTLLLLMLVW
jgi:hypothetical protein